MGSLAKDIKPAIVDSHTYRVNLLPEWCIGTVPHGGFVTSCFMAVARQHFTSTLPSYNQPDTFILHLEFIRRTAVGPALFKVRDVKLGRRTSTVHITLVQGADMDNELVSGYLTNTNLAQESGISLPTDWSLHPKPAPVDLAKLRTNSDPNWVHIPNLPFADFRKATTKIDLFLPRERRLHMPRVDEWIRLRDGGRFSLESLGYCCDIFPQLVENFDPDHHKKPLGRFWYPTLVLNLDIKKALPPEGVEFLFLSVRAQKIQNGRMDLQIIILDEAGDLVALSHHVSLILSASRNTAARKPKPKPSSEPKL